MKKIQTILLGAALIVNAASAITFSGFASQSLFAADGTTALTNGSSTYLIADGGDGFDFDATVAGLTFADGSLIGATNDYVFAYNAAQNFGPSISVASGNTNFSINDAGASAGYSFALLYFNGTSGASVTTIGGEQFGFLTSGDWTIPANDSGTFNFGSEFSAVTGSANLTVAAVPEPSTFAALAGLCALGAVMVRRRRA